MDLHERVTYSPIVGRQPLAWPNGERLAVWVAPNIEHYEYLPPENPLRNPWPRTPHPDVQQYSFRDYGNRVGVWRMARALADFEIPCTVSLNIAVLDHYPEIRELICSSHWAIMSHGIYNTRYLYRLTADEEREFYRDCIDSVRRHTGLELRGMLGPAISGTERTPDLMAEAGLIYHADWVHDDQPVRIHTETGPLVSVPYTYEINDAPVFARHYSADDFVDMATTQFDRLYAEGEASGRVFCLALHPFLIGQPHMDSALRRILAHIRRHNEIWLTTADEIALYYLRQYPKEPRENIQREALEPVDSGGGAV